MTRFMYIERPDLFEATGQIISHSSDSKGEYLVLDSTIFYPQGGGQPADQGEIIASGTAYNVYDVRNIDGEGRHYITDSPNVNSGDTVTLIVNRNRRVINSKYHTAGHLIAAITEKMFPELIAIKGHQFPGEAYVEFNGIIDSPGGFFDKITQAIKDSIDSDALVKTDEMGPEDSRIITENLSYDLPKTKTLRVCHIAGFSPVPCGGTHVKTLKDIATVKVVKCKSKKDKTKVYYEIS